ncbi:COQ9 family protein [Sphingomonas sp. KRR8]|uniref:COQ9 family protein n=1 Tax=Sphingomonas sp. KRR8 TaxID=2942996 RepID=UPI0020209895|nr:COQ9 family protein [Sphingomonas sp. KRR8]URD60160.1 COQ9 family protein [Sphingomonas sp. KRR8]
MDEITPLERIRRQLALSVGENAVFDGWTGTAVDAAADAHGITREQARLAMPKDAVGLIDLYGQAIDRELTAAFPPERIAAMKIRARIRELLWARIQLQAPAKEAVRRALATLAMPQNLAAAARLSWRTTDHIWRLAGDTATDYNHFTKRLTLGAVYGSTLLAWLQDETEDSVATAAFLDRRIDEVMRFEQFKARWRDGSERRPSLTRFVARLRYPPR